MDRLNKLEEKVRALYKENNPKRADWADWLADHHVFVVADNASKLAKKYGANEELARVAALLHDIADTKTQRSDEKHEELSLQMARELMKEAGYNDDEIKLVVDDAIRYHSCYEGEHPESIEGKILSTADSLAHLKTDFYVFATWAFARDMSLDEIKEWILKKIDRDLNNKIFFDEVREEVSPDYERIKELFSR
ncbi:HD domain-containing protein [Candidatus Roizmanbacteria bacterium]|nr:HD domain-containing protein [Candidatus Roizmanbacteria bacterium]